MQLEIRNVSKTYRNGVQALKNVSLTIPTGMYGLLGPNGAGKSMLMRTIATLQQPDTGSIRLGDLDVLKQKDEVRKALGDLPQEFGVYPNVTAERLLDHFAVLEGITNKQARKRFAGETVLYSVPGESRQIYRTADEARRSSVERARSRRVRQLEGRRANRASSAPARREGAQPSWTTGCRAGANG